MEIQSDTRIVDGKHKGLKFRYREGLLELYNKSWTKIEIRKLVEIANLLEIHGYKLKVKPKKVSRLGDSIGLVPWMDWHSDGFSDGTTYDESQEETEDEPEGY